jgi:plastocyanin
MKNRKFAVAIITMSLSTILAATAGDLSGKVSFSGDAPKVKKIKMDADPKCAEMHGGESVPGEDVVINPNGTLKNVFVYVKSGLEGKTFEPSKDPVEVDQKGCMYYPRVVGMQAKQPIKFKNSDDTLHNVHAMPTKSKEFNIGQPNKGMESIRTFAAPEMMVKVKCDVHPWMTGYIGVMDHPFYATTGDDGTYTIKGLPAGEYEIVAWHEKLGEQTSKVKVGDDAATADFTFKAE